MDEGKLSIFHPNMAVTKQGLLYISHILHVGSVRAISTQQQVRLETNGWRKPGEGLPLWQAQVKKLQLALDYFKRNVHASLLDLGMTIHYSQSSDGEMVTGTEAKKDASDPDLGSDASLLPASLQYVLEAWLGPH